MRALWAFDDAVKVALDFQRRHPETLVIVTGDHETGGFSPTYALKDLSTVSSSNRFYAGDAQLRMLERITMSFNAVEEKLGKSPSGDMLDQVLAKAFPGFRLDPDLRERILGGKTDERNFSYLPHNALGRMVARQTGYLLGHVRTHPGARDRRSRGARSGAVPRLPGQRRLRQASAPAAPGQVAARSHLPFSFRSSYGADHG